MPSPKCAYDGVGVRVGVGVPGLGVAVAGAPEVVPDPPGVDEELFPVDEAPLPFAAAIPPMIQTSSNTTAMPIQSLRRDRFGGIGGGA